MLKNLFNPHQNPFTNSSTHPPQVCSHGLLWVKTLRQWCSSFVIHATCECLAHNTSPLADDDMKCADKGESWANRWELPLPNPLSGWEHKDSVPHLWFTQLMNIFHIMWMFKKCMYVCVFLKEPVFYVYTWSWKERISVAPKCGPATPDVMTAQTLQGFCQFTNSAWWNFSNFHKVRALGVCV